jgi:hypothetical protein
MSSWEDWLYWIMLSRAGKCFTRIAEPLVVYRFYTGNRREIGIKDAQKLLQYIANKLSGVKPMPCGCKNRSTIAAARNAVVQRTEITGESTAEQNLTDDSVVMILYSNPNSGMHRVVGAASGQDYGYRSGGGIDRFYVKIEDQRVKPDWFKIVEINPVVEEDRTPANAPPPPEPKSIKRRG